MKDSVQIRSLPIVSSQDAQSSALAVFTNLPDACGGLGMCSVALFQLSQRNCAWLNSISIQRGPLSQGEEVHPFAGFPNCQEKQKSGFLCEISGYFIFGNECKEIFKC